MPLIQLTMGCGVTPLHFALHAKAPPPHPPRPAKLEIRHSLNAACIIDSDIQREYIGSIQSLNMKGKGAHGAEGFCDTLSFI